MPNDTKLEIFRSLSERGFYLFPLQPGKKWGYEGWPQHATNDTKQIEEWYLNGGVIENQRDSDKDPRSIAPGCEFGIATGPSGLLVVDLDIKPEKDIDGVESYGEFCKAHGEPDKKASIKVRTPSGGLHLYFAGQSKTTVKAGGLPGLDIRSKGGLVVAPSTTQSSEGSYVLERDEGDLVRAPVAWVKAIGEPKERSLDALEIVDGVEPDEPLDIQQAYNFLANTDPFKIGERDNRTYQTACQLKNLGLSADTTEPMLYEWLEANNILDESFTEKDVHKCVISAYLTSQDPQGRDSAQLAMALFDSVSLEQKMDEVKPEDIAGLGIVFKDVGDIVAANIPRPDWLMKGWLLKGYCSVFIAPGGVGKSTATIVEALAMATGRPLLGETPAKASVNALIYNAEDCIDVLQMRMAATCQHHGVPLESMAGKIALISGRQWNMKLCAKGPNNSIVVNTRCLAVLRNFIRARNIDLLYLDPFIRIHDLCENDNNDVDNVMNVLTSFADTEKIAICIVHHSRKLNDDSGAGNVEVARGASSMTSAARFARTATTMTIKETGKYGLVDLSIDPDDEHYVRKGYVRLDEAKNNMAKASTSALWIKHVGPTIANGEEVGTFESVNLNPVPKPDRRKANETEMWDYVRVLVMDSKEPIAIVTMINEIVDSFGMAESTARRRLMTLKDEPLLLGEGAGSVEITLEMLDKKWYVKGGFVL
jgi:hypothetical protein